MQGIRIDRPAPETDMYDAFASYVLPKRLGDSITDEAGHILPGFQTAIAKKLQTTVEAIDPPATAFEVDGNVFRNSVYKVELVKYPKEYLLTFDRAYSETRPYSKRTYEKVMKAVSRVFASMPKETIRGMAELVHQKPELPFGLTRRIKEYIGKSRRLRRKTNRRRV